MPIARDYSSLLKRMVSDEGRSAQTEYWIEKRLTEIALVDIQLHTGRTHQIRVHFSAIGCALLGDDMYGGRMDLGIKDKPFIVMICVLPSIYRRVAGVQAAFSRRHGGSCETV